MEAGRRGICIGGRAATRNGEEATVATRRVAKIVTDVAPVGGALGWSGAAPQPTSRTTVGGVVGGADAKRRVFLQCAMTLPSLHSNYCHHEEGQLMTVVSSIHSYLGFDRWRPVQR